MTKVPTTLQKNNVITTYKAAVFRTNSLLIQRDHILVNQSVFRMGMTNKCGNATMLMHNGSFSLFLFIHSNQMQTAGAALDLFEYIL